MAHSAPSPDRRQKIGSDVYKRQIYNSTIEGVMETSDQLIEKCPMLADFKAVQSGDCWCTAQSLFQQSMELADLISDMNLVFTEGSPDPASLRFLQRIV